MHDYYKLDDIDIVLEETQLNKNQITESFGESILNLNIKFLDEKKESAYKICINNHHIFHNVEYINYNPYGFCVCKKKYVFDGELI
jgi:hypothetical protein